MTQAQAPAEERVVSSFPDPPSSLYKVYTDESVSSGLAPKPPAPIKGKYYMFGCLFDVSLSMDPRAVADLTLLSPHSDRGCYDTSTGGAGAGATLPCRLWSVIY